MFKKTLKELSGHSFFYALSYLASSAAGIILLPVYTRFLSRADYGILEMLDYTNIIITIIIGAGLNSAIPKFFSEAESGEEKKVVLSSGTLFSFFAGAVFCVFALMFDDSLGVLILGKAGLQRIIDLNIAIFYVQLVTFISGIGFMAAKRSKIYLTYMLARLVTAIAANLYFIIVLKLGLMGMLLGNLLAYGLVAIVICSHNTLSNGIRVSLPVLKKLAKFGLPLVPAMLMATIMHNADRFLIRYFGSLDDVGIYSLGYKFPFMLNALILQSFSYIWTGATMYEISKQPDSSFQYGRITTYVMGVFMFAQLALCLFSVPVVKLLAAPKFFPAHAVIPYIGLGLCFHALYFFFSVGTFVEKKTWRLNLAYFPAAAINIIGNIVLLPRYGYMAAAWMSTITYFVFAAVLYFSCRKLIEVKYEFGRLFSLYIMAAATFFASSLVSISNPLLEGMKDFVFLGLFLVIIATSGFLTKGEKESFKRFVTGLSWAGTRGS
jgi:O-antigen/teichoic acid export membrane protein